MPIFFQTEMKLKSTISKKSPVILATLGIAGFVTSVVLSAKAAPAANAILEEKPEDAPFIEKAKAVAPVYAPTAGMMLIATACIVASNRIQQYRYASLFALYSFSQRAINQWQNAVVEEIGEKRFAKVKERVVEPPDPVPIGLVDYPGSLFFDHYTGRYFTHDSVEGVRKIINDMNQLLMSEDFVSLNEFYFWVNLPETQFGNEQGWHAQDGMIDVTFDSFLKHDRPIISVYFKTLPTARSRR